jgi:hypothetical protein
MKKNNKHLHQFKECKAGLKLFYEETLLINDYEELQNHLNNLASYFKQVENDQAKNKNIILFKTYLNNEAEKKSIDSIKKKKIIKNTKKKIGFKDYLSEYHILKNRGMSYRGIAKYSEKYYKVKVSKDTLIKYLNQHED